jgi:hypothetical protein
MVWGGGRGGGRGGVGRGRGRGGASFETIFLHHLQIKRFPPLLSLNFENKYWERRRIQNLDRIFHSPYYA